MYRAVVSAAAASALCCGCSEGARHRWASASGLSKEHATPTISVYLAPADPPGSPKLSDLSDRAQGELVAQIARLSKNEADFKTNYQKFFKQDIAQATADAPVLNRLLVISIGRDGYRPADRLVTAKVLVEPTDFQFTGYTLVATAYGSLDLDKVDVKDQTTGSAEINPTLAGSVKGPIDLKAGFEHTTDHSYTVTDVAPKPYVEVQCGKLSLNLGSEPNQDLAGTTIVKVTLIPNTQELAQSPTESCPGVSGYKTVGYHLIASDQQLFKNDKALPPSKASLKAVEVPYTSGTLHARVRMDYEYRFVQAGADTPVEDDDTAEYEAGTVSARGIGASTGQANGVVEIMDGGARGFTLWALEAGGAGLEATLTNGQSEPLLFNSLAAATEMVRWLGLSHSWSVGATRLSLIDAPARFPPFHIRPQPY